MICSFHSFIHSFIFFLSAAIRLALACIIILCKIVDSIIQNTRATWWYFCSPRLRFRKNVFYNLVHFSYVLLCFCLGLAKQRRQNVFFSCEEMAETLIWYIVEVVCIMRTESNDKCCNCQFLCAFTWKDISQTTRNHVIGELHRVIARSWFMGIHLWQWYNVAPSTMMTWLKAARFSPDEIILRSHDMHRARRGVQQSLVWRCANN